MKRPAAVLLGLLGAAVLHAQTKPSADSIYPAGAGAPTNTKILIRSACCFYAQDAAVALSAGAQVVAGKVEVIDSVWLVFTPEQPLQPNTAYSVVVRVAGRTPTLGSFSTGPAADTTAPRFLSSTPAHLQDTLALGQPVQLRFSEPLNPKSVRAAAPRLVELGLGYTSSGTVQLDDPATIRIYPSSQFTFGGVYRVEFPATLPEDLSGNVLPAPAPEVLFTTYPSAPKDGARLAGSVPADGESGVPTNSAIVLLFDRPVIPPAAGALALASEGDPKVALKVEALEAGNAVILRPQTLLRGNQRYTLSVSVLYDRYGGQVAAGTLLRFTTATLPELRPFTLVTSPAAKVPRVGRLRWSYNRAINPYVLPQLSRYPAGQQSPVRLLEDGQTIEADVSGSGSYSLTGPVYDRVEFKGGDYGRGAIVGAVPDTKAPAPVAIFPPDQASGVPPAANPGIRFDEPIVFPTADQFQLWQGGNRVEASIAGYESSYTIKPRLPLSAGLDYRVQFRAPSDQAGNAGADIEWSFHVDPPPAAEAFRVLQSEPAANATGVPTDSTIVVTFNHLPNLVPVFPSCSELWTTAGRVSGSWRADGNRAIFRPDEPFPPSSGINWRLCGLTDLYGQALAASWAEGTFWTAASAEAAPPLRATLAAPADGEAAVVRDDAIILKFNQAVSGSTVNTNSIYLSNLSGQRVEASVLYDSATREARLTTGYGLDGLHIVTATSEVRSLREAPLEPFSAVVRLARPAVSEATPAPVFLRSAHIPTDSGTVLTDPPVVVFFRSPMDRALVEQALRVVVSDAVVSGRIEWAPDSTALTFYPSKPLAGDESGRVVLSLVPWNRGGVESITVSTGRRRYPPAPVQWNWSYSVSLPSDGVIDLAFDGDRPADFVRGATARSVSPLNGQPDGVETLALEIEQRSARVFRLRSRQAFGQRRYSLEITTGDGGKLTNTFQNAGYATPASPRIDAGPSDEMGDVPVNALIWIEAHTLLNPFTVNARLTAGGEAVRFVVEISDRGMRVLLRPVGLLRGNSTYTVELKGLEDMAGRPLPDRAWTFHTGAGPDFVPVTLTSWSPKGTASTAATVQATFSKPVFYIRAVQDWEAWSPRDFAVSAGGITILGDIEASADGRTLRYVPRRPWPANAAVSIEVSRFRYLDWTGAMISDPAGSYPVVPTFTASAAAGGAPAVTARNPQPDAVGIPRNVLIQARFENGILEPAAGRVTLTADGAETPVQAVLTGDGRTLTVLPTRMLEANRLYTVTLSGLTGSDGTMKEEAEQWSFTTAETATGAPLQPIVTPLWEEPISFRVLLPRAVNPVSVNTSAVSLSLSQKRVAFELAVEDQGRALRITPLSPPAAKGVWEISVSGLTDAAGLAFPAVSLSVSTAAPANTSPPRVQALLPAPGSTVAWNVAAAAVFDKPVLLRYGAAGVRLFRDGVPVAATTTPLSSGALSVAIPIAPLLGWQPGSTYRVEISGVVDGYGNEAAPLSWSFSTAGGGVAEASPLRLLSVSPANGAVGVAASEPLVFQFSRPALTATGDFYPWVNVTPEVPSGFRIVHDGNSIRLEPSPSWKPGVRISAQLRVRDLYGNSSTFSSSFSTTAPEDKVPPRVESVTPAPGSVVAAGWNEFRLRFNEPVMFSSAFARFSCEGMTWPAERSTTPAQGDGRTVVVGTTLPASKTCVLSLASDLTDLAGNALEPAVYEYTVDSSSREGYARVESLQPAPGSGDIPTGAVLTLRFNQAMNEASVRNAIRVTNDGYAVPVTSTPDDARQVWTIVPAAPFLPGTVVQFEVGTTAYSQTGMTMYEKYTALFRTAAAGASTSSSAALAAVRATPRFVDLRFAAPGETPPEEPFGLRQGHVRIPVVADRLGPAWYRLTPGAPLEAGGRYTLMAGPGVEMPLRIVPEEESAGSADPVVTRDEAGRISLRFAAPIHAFSVDGTTLMVLDGDGQEVPHAAHLTVDGRTVVIEPFGARRAEEVRWQRRRQAIR